MLSTVTGVATGQKAKNHIGKIKHTATIFTGKPNLPNDQRRGGSGAPYSRRQISVPMTTT